MAEDRLTYKDVRDSAFSAMRFAFALLQMAGLRDDDAEVPRGEIEKFRREQATVLSNPPIGKVCKND